MLKFVAFCSLCSLHLKKMNTIMDKSLETVIQFVFNTRYINIRTLLTLHVPIPSPHPMDSVETV